MNGHSQMKAEDWPLCLPKRDWRQVRSLADFAIIFTEDLVNRYRTAWDLITLDAPQIPSGGRQWYLHRETGLRALARREAELSLKHFSRDGLITGADYCACILQEVLFSWGWREALSPGCVPANWKRFISWPGFAPRLQLWKSRRALARHSPVPHIKGYARLYDRAGIPLEFCSDDYSAHLMTVWAREKNWIGESETFSRQNVRRWRRDLGLKPSKHVVAKFPHPRKAESLSFPIRESSGQIDRGLEGNYAVEIDAAAAKAVGLPYDFAELLTSVGQWRTR
jgi:hypothetical protein